MSAAPASTLTPPTPRSAVTPPAGAPAVPAGADPTAAPARPRRMAGPNPPGVTPEWRKITLDEATQLVETMGPNRPLTRAHVEGIKHEYENGTWVEPLDPIARDKKKRLRNGLHRLTAQIELGIDEMWHLWADGLSEKQIEALDQGRRRTLADAGAVTGTLTPAEAPRVTAAARWIGRIREAQRRQAAGEGVRGLPAVALSNAEGMRLVSAHLDALRHAAHRVAPVRAMKPQAVWIAVYALARELHADLADLWIDALIEDDWPQGAQKRTDPVWLLSKTVMRPDKERAPTPVQAAAMMVKSFNAFTQKRPGDRGLTRLTYAAANNPDEPFPALEWGGRVATQAELRARQKARDAEAE